MNKQAVLSCLNLERWQGPPHINKVKQYKLCWPLRSVCLFILGRKRSANEDLSLLITFSTLTLHRAPLTRDRTRKCKWGICQHTVASCCFSTVCKYTVHERCVSKDIAACISTYAKSRRHTNVSTNRVHERLLLCKKCLADNMDWGCGVMRKEHWPVCSAASCWLTVSSIGAGRIMGWSVRSCTSSKYPLCFSIDVIRLYRMISLAQVTCWIPLWRFVLFIQASRKNSLTNMYF